jgi:hypothetical protein
LFSLLLLNDVIDLEPGILRSCSSSSSGVGCSPLRFRVQGLIAISSRILDHGSQQQVWFEVSAESENGL